MEYEDLCVCLIDPVECEGVRRVRWSAMPHEYACLEIPWGKDSGPQYPKFWNIYSKIDSGSFTTSPVNARNSPNSRI